MALAAAHICPPDYALKPSVRRNVIIITESVIQVQRVIYSLYTWGYTGASVRDFDSRIKIINAQRLDPKIVAQVADEYRGWTVENEKKDGTYYSALPLVVFDTANAVFDMENENDNAEVGRAMAYIKQAFSDFPVIIITHTAKALGSLESDFLSPRGASAWTGDAQGVYTVFKDGETQDSPRVLKATKVRFPTVFNEVTFDLVSNAESHSDVLGYMKEIWFSHSVARPLKPGERSQLKEDMKIQRENDQMSALCSDMLNLMKEKVDRSRSFYERLPVAEGGVKGSQERKQRAINMLLEDGLIEVVDLPRPVGRTTQYIRVVDPPPNIDNANKYGL
jgi:hypothetical protein